MILEQIIAQSGQNLVKIAQILPLLHNNLPQNQKLGRLTGPGQLENV